MAYPRYSQPNVITLGSLEYVLEGDVTRMPANEYAVGLRMGAPDYDNREGASFKNYDDFRGGLGLKYGDAREFPDRFWDSRGIRTWDGFKELMMAPLLTEASLGSIVPSYPASTPGPGGEWTVAPVGTNYTYTLFGAMGNKVFKNTSTTSPSFTNITPGGAPASAQTFALTYHVNPTDLNDRAVYWALGVDADIWKYNLNTETWSQPSAGAKAHDFIEFDRKLLKVYAGQVSMSADGGVSWTDIVKVPWSPNGAPRFAGVGLDAYGQLMPYLMAEGILYVIDVWTRQAIPIDLGLPSSVTAGIVWQDGEVVVTDGYYVKAYHPSRPVKDMGLNRDHGSEQQFLIRNFYVVAGKYLIARCDIGTSNQLALLLWDGNGWHVIEAGDAIFGAFGKNPNPAKNSVIMFNGSSFYNPAQVLFIMGYTTRPYIYYCNTEAFRNPQLVPTHKYTTISWVVTPWFDGGFAEMPGTAIEVETHGIFSSTKQLKIEYALNDSSTYTELGTTSGSSEVQRFQFASGQGISFKNIRFRFSLLRGSTNTETPIVHAIIFKYVKKPRLRSRFVFTVDVVHSARHQGRTEEQVIDSLYALSDDTPLVNFAYTGEGPFWCDVKELPRRDLFVQDGSSKVGTLRVVLEEPV